MRDDVLRPSKATPGPGQPVDPGSPAADLPEGRAFTLRHFRDRIAPGAPPRAPANSETQVDRPHP